MELMHARKHVDIVSLVFCRYLEVVAVLQSHFAAVDVAFADAAAALAAEDPRLGKP